ncbi:MAG: hypothetical protein ISR59_07215 [Anaerolineales bacterium]|uniref:SH3 domain-containing protein n=1 Tax=Candidatus Desulfolinea nitratireducens TaxID=2841698 RepID=A0A8J6NH03_9CHLR|nr:hypothetical protein [Candidatus Desulfolinea nitratireducens]MBL6960883.1 hypothetical protein [Anaerolineales bacterium]
MSEPSTTDKKKTAGLQLSTEVIVAIISVLGVIIVAVFGYLQSRLPYEYSWKGTQTAEARLTQIALSFTPTFTKSPPTKTPPGPDTNTPTKTPTRTPSLAPPIPGRPEGLRYCINAFLVNVRIGPSTQYGAIGNLRDEDCLFFDASNVEGTWLRIAANQPEEYQDLELGWVYIELLGLLGNSRLPVITLTPTPTYTPSQTLTPSLTPTPTLTITPTAEG